MSLAIISHPDCALHDAGLGHPEAPARVQVIQEALEKLKTKVPIKFHRAKPIPVKQLYLAHDKEYVSWILSIAPKADQIAIDPDTIMNAHTLDAALLAAGSVVQAVDLVITAKAQAVFCNVRPPGHHAERDKAMGFCFFNNVAIGAAYAMEAYGLKRIAIIDFDVHHGNGTQNIFYNDDRVLFCSSFQHPFYPGYDEESGNEHFLFVPLPADVQGAQFRKAVSKAWFQPLIDFQPELIFFSAGFDGHKNDPLANFNLQKEDYVWLTKEIAKIAKVSCQGRMISSLEGGYDLEVLAECVPAHVKAMVV